MVKSEEELKRLLMRVKEGSEKAGLTLNIQKTKIMPSSLITSWQIDGETKETVTDFILGVSKITADSDHSHEIKRCLLPGRKSMTNLDSTLKSRDITLPTEICLVKTMVFPVQFSRSVVYGSLQPREPQHTRPPCPSPTPGVYPNSCPLSQWCHPTISSSVVPFSSLPPIPPSIRVFSNESTLRIRWPKY